VEKAVIDYLKPRVFIFREYENNEKDVILVAVVYHENNRWGPHDVEVCYKSQGWKIIDGNADKLKNNELDLNEFKVEKNGHRELVVYWWFTQNGEQMSSRLKQMYYLIKYGLLNRYSGGGMVRISIFIPSNKEEEMRGKIINFAKPIIVYLANR
jgi:EpsI family protein